MQSVPWSECALTLLQTVRQVTLSSEEQGALWKWLLKADQGSHVKFTTALVNFVQLNQGRFDLSDDTLQSLAESVTTLNKTKLDRLFKKQ
jgi:hypothetical protein